MGEGDRVKIKIYGLYDPSTSDLRYIGKTKHLLSTRLSQHISEAKKFNKTHRHKWIRRVLGNGQLPIIKLLEKVTENDWETSEKEWIANCRKKGLNLVNETDGGESPEGRKLSKEHIEKIRQTNLGNKHSLGYKHSRETKRKMSVAHKGNQRALGHKHSPETIEKLRKASTGKKLSDGAKRKISNSKLGKARSEETKQKLRLANVGKRHSEETKQKMRDAHKRRKNGIN